MQTKLERQLLIVRTLRESIPNDPRMYFYLNEMLKTKVHKRTEKLKGAGRVTEERFAEDRKEVD